MRALRISAVVLVVLCGLFVLADRIAVQIAEDKAADRIKSSQDLANKPDLSIRGFPFLTQVLSDKFDKVDAKLTGITAETAGTTLKVDEITVQLNDVRVSDGYRKATADRASGEALIGFDDLSKAAPQGVTVGYGGSSDSGKPMVKVTAKVRVPLLGQEVERSVNSAVSIVGRDTVRLRADEVPFANIPGVEAEIRKRIDFARTISGLPEGLELDRVEVTEEGVKLTVKGENVELSS